MEKIKRQKYERELRQSLKTVVDLVPNLMAPSSTENHKLISKLYPNIADLNTLKIVTVLEITYLLQAYLELLDKHNPALIADLRVGIIGGGVSGRLVLNSILPLSKDGLSTRNITVSTRQTENFKSYEEYFGVRVHFDNELTALESDVLIVATPATLDNWIIKDLKQPLEQRIKASEKKNKIENLNAPLVPKISHEKSKISTSKVEENKERTIQAENPQPSRVFPFKPLVYILTSDFNDQKCQRLFPFKVLTPSIRAKDIIKIKQALELLKVQGCDSFEGHQRLLAWWLNQERQARGLQSLDSHSARQINLETSENGHEKYLKTNLGPILKAFAFVVDSSLQTSSITSSISNTVSVCENITDRKAQQPIGQVLELFAVQGEVDQALIKKIRKWKMAFNNYLT